MRFAMAFAAALMASVTASRAGNIDFGTVELSGTASTTRGSSNYSSETGLSFYPAVSLYLLPFMNIGPILNWSHFTYEYDRSNSATSSNSILELGGKLGFLVNWSDGFGRPLPYFDLGLGGAFLKQKYTTTTSDKGLFVLGTAGVKLKIGECFYISLSESYTHNSVVTFDNQFTSGVGFSGLIGK